MLIKNIKAKQILDVTGRPTIECTLNGSSASVPSGTSAGVHEAKAIDAGKAVENVNKSIIKEISGKDFSTQQEFDSALIELDGTKDKSSLGANAILAVSMAFCKAYAEEKQVSLYESLSEILKSKPSMPVPQFNLINSGKHAGKDIFDIQEHMIMPVGAESFKEALQMGIDVYKALGGLIKKKRIPIKLGLEHGYTIQLTVEERLEMLLSAIEERGYVKEIKLALDCAASEFFANGKYIINNRKFDSMELVDFYKELVEAYPIVSIEDGLNEEDFDNWAEMKKINIQVVGDDLLTTNPSRIKKAIEKKSCNAMILKPNQIGTVSEAIEAAILAKKSKWNVIVSHRSRETEDTFIADLATAIGDQCKFGAPAKDRLLKYNRLLEIEKASKLKYSRFNL